MNLKSKEKQEWRNHLKALLEKESPFTSVQIQNSLTENLLHYLRDKNGIWAGYNALPQEPDLSPIFQHSLPIIQWAFPRMESDHLTFYLSPHFVKGPYGVMEPPATAQKISVRDLSGVLVPGLGFNKQGRRLGKGKGFYDKALARYKGPKVGICFACQVVDEDLPIEEHDVRMDVLITEKGVHTWKF